MARRVILEMDVHCTNCAMKIRRAVQNHLGVEMVQVTLDTGLVVITGTADAEVLRRRIQQKLQRKVKIISGGAAPRQRYEPQYGGWAAPPAPPRRYGAAPEPAYPPYAENRWEAPPRRYSAAPEQAYPPYAENRWEAPPHRYGVAPEPAYPPYAENRWEAPPRRYGVAPEPAYPPYAGNRWEAPPRRRHVSYGVPARREDDEEGPENCCSIQ